MSGPRSNLAIGLLFTAACLAYVVSFAMPVFEGGERDLLGYQAFVLSLYLLLVLIPTWLANPLFWFALFSYSKRRFRKSLVCSRFAVLVGLTGLIWVIGTPQFVPAWQGDFNHVRLTGIGYYVWMASFVLLAVSRWLAERADRQRNVIP